MRPKDGELAEPSTEQVKSLTKPQSAVRSPVYVAVVINNYTQVYYFNRCCTSVLLITKILGLKNRLYKESEILPWCFFQHMHKPVRAASAACEQIQNLQLARDYKLMIPVWSPVKVRIRDLSAGNTFYYMTPEKFHLSKHLTENSF